MIALVFSSIARTTLVYKFWSKLRYKWLSDLPQILRGMKNGKHGGIFLLVTIKYIKIGRITTKTSILSQEIGENKGLKET